VPADVGEEQLEAVGCAGQLGRRLEGCRLGCGLLGLRLGGGGSTLGRDGRADLEADPLELARELLDLFLVEIELERERLELGRLDVATLLRTLDEGASLVGFEQFVKLVLRQGLPIPLRIVPGRTSASLLTLGGKSSACQGNRPPPAAPGHPYVRTWPSVLLFRSSGFLGRLRANRKVELDLPLLV
jgi:hypothetical protein